MAKDKNPCPITIDLNQFKLHIRFKNKVELTLHFNSPSRRFYLSVIALVVNEMKRQGKIISIPLEGHHDLLALLNDTVGASAGASDKENLLPRIYRKWKDALPNLEEAPLFKVLGRKRESAERTGKSYPFTDSEKDSWANLFEYKGSEENVRLKFAIDRIGESLDDVEIVYEDRLNGDAWERFILSLKEEKGEKEKAEPDRPASAEPEAVSPPPEITPERRKTLLPIRYRWVALIASIVVVLGAISLAIWRIHPKPDPDDVASIEKMAFPLPDNPSIAVLPFVNLSGDPKQGFLSDGMTEEIITALARVPRMFVIARTSTDTYKGKPVKVKQVSEELGVQYVLEGSVHRSGDRIRITAQLIDALTGNHLWSKRYDRELKDIFALQDEIIVNILLNVQMKLTEGGDALRAEKFAEKYFRGKQGLEYYLRLMQANDYIRRWNSEDNNSARRMIEELIEMCPENPRGYEQLAWIYHHDYRLRNTKSPETLEKAIELARKALSIADYPSPHALLCNIYATQRHYDKAIAEGQRAIALDPGGVQALVNYANCLAFSGRPEEAMPLYQKAIRLSPFGPSYLYQDFGWALSLSGRFEEAVSAYKKAIRIAPDNFLAHRNLAITYGSMGKERETRAEAAEVLRINPKFSLDSVKEDKGWRDQPQKMEKVFPILRKAGLK